MRDLSRVVILDWLFSGTGERWTAHSDHLSETDRATARAILESQHSAKWDGLLRALEQAYGVAKGQPGVLADGQSHERVLTSLDRSFDPGELRGATFAAAFEDLLDRAYASTYPAHPEFEPGDQEVRLPELRAVRDHLVRAMEHPDKRVPLEGDVKAVRRVANALGVGYAAETAFIFGDDRFTPWGNELAKAIGREDRGSAPVTAGDLRRWIDAVHPPAGLRREVSDLVIIAWALLRQRAWYHYGAPIDAPDPGKVADTVELRQLPMPTQGEWEAAVEAAGAIFGVHEARLLTPQRLASLTEKVRERTSELTGPATALTEHIEQAYERLGIHTDGAGRSGDRLRTARDAADLLIALRPLDDLELVRRLGDVNGRRDALGTSLTAATSVAEALRGFPWERLDPLRKAPEGDATARTILDGLASAIADDEIVQRASQALQKAEKATFDWATAQRPPSPPSPPVPDDGPNFNRAGDVPVDPPKPGSTVADRGGRRITRDSNPDVVIDELRSFLRTHRSQDVTVQWWVNE